MPRPIPITDRLIVWQHWYRTPGGANYGTTTCAHQTCGQSGTARLGGPR